jgi:phosphate-selective porin OprO and OprP
VCVTYCGLAGNKMRGDFASRRPQPGCRNCTDCADPTGTVCARTSLIPLILALSATVPVRAQVGGFATERPVEDRGRETDAGQKLEAPKPDPGPADGKKPPLLAGWDDKSGFVLRSADSDFQLRITGQIQPDCRYYLDDRDAVDLPNLLVRRARLGIEATVFQHYDFRLLPEFGQGQTRLLDAYLNARWWDEFQLEAGKFKQPFSYEQLIQDRFVPTLERSMIDQLVPARDVGVMVHGYKLFDDRFDYQASVFGGVINGDQDNDRNKEVAGRIAVRPLRGLGLPAWAEPVQLGVATTFGNDRGVLAPATLRTPDGVPWFQFLPTARPDGTRTRLCPEFAYVSGPFGLLAQYFEEHQELRFPAGRRGPAGVVDVSYRGGFVLATALLTGEERKSFSQAVTPLAPFDPPGGCYGPGAWELVGRVSWLGLDADDPRGFARLIDPTRSATRATELTAGFNWYWNAWVRLQFNWEHARFNNAVRLGPTAGNRLDRQNTFLTRLQIIF